MRHELLDPLKGSARYKAAVKLVRRIYESIASGKDFSEALTRLGKVVCKGVTAFEIEDAAELIEPESFAYELIVGMLRIPNDLAYDEMLELVGRVVANADDVLRLGYWTQCLEVNTGDNRISTLIQSPNLYFGDPNVARQLSAQEILNWARWPQGEEIV